MNGNGNGGSDYTADLLVVGGGIAGTTAAIEAAEVGKKAILVEKNPYLGGRVLQMSKYFPKLCPPSCGLEINFRRIKQNGNVRTFTLAEVKEVSGEKGNYEVKVALNPRYVSNKCTACNLCADVCPVSRTDEFNYGMKETKAVYLPNPMAFPMKYVIDMDVCEGESCGKCVAACPYDAIDLKMQTEIITVKVKSIIWATGWKPYDAKKLDNLGFGDYSNVITNVMMERLAAEDGPTEGKIVRPSDNGGIQSIAFVQCAGSRDENHLPYCSTVCCAASLKQVSYVREQFPDAEIHVFYIDIRTPGRLEDVYMKIQEDEKVFFHRGKVAKVEEVENNNLVVTAEDTLTGTLTEQKADMVVLAVGLVPNSKNGNLPVDLPKDEYGFILPGGLDAMFGVGTAVRPMEVSAVNQDATGAVLKSIQVR